MRQASLRRIIVDSPARITVAHSDAALAHLRRRFRLEALGDLSAAAALGEALGECGVETAPDGEGGVLVTGGRPRAARAEHALTALCAVAPYVTPGGHLLACTDAGELLSLRFENAQVYEPRGTWRRPLRGDVGAVLDRLARLIPETRRLATALRHDLDPFQVAPDVADRRRLFGEAKCRRCYDSACFRHTEEESFGQALTRALPGAARAGCRDVIPPGRAGGRPRAAGSGTHRRKQTDEGSPSRQRQLSSRRGAERLMDSFGFEEFLPPGVRGHGRPPEEPRAEEPGGGEPEATTRVVLLTRRGDLTLLVLKLDADLGIVGQSTLGGGRPTARHLPADEARAEFHRTLRAYTEHYGWKVLFDGGPCHDPSDGRFRPMMEALEALLSTPAPGESRDSDYQEVETRVTLSAKGGMLAVTGLKTTPSGGKIQTVVAAADGERD